MTNIPAPVVSRVLEVEQSWIDYNGHMNMAFYNVLFDRGSEEAFARMGMGADYASERKLTIYTAEIHVCYVRELHQGDRVTVNFQILDRDDKRLHIYQEIHHEDGWLAATCENMSLHVDMNGPKVVPFPADVEAKVAALCEEQASLPVPARANRSIGIRRKGR